MQMQMQMQQVQRQRQVVNLHEGNEDRVRLREQVQVHEPPGARPRVRYSNEDDLYDDDGGAGGGGTPGGDRRRRRINRVAAGRRLDFDADFVDIDDVGGGAGM